MLRVGLTGGLGSGKSTAAALFAGLGAHVLRADEIARGLMQPGERVYAEIVAAFGPKVVLADGTLNRGELARLAFSEGRLDALNAIVHPATIMRQAELTEAIARRDPRAIVVVESALIFETQYGETQYPDGGANATPWRERFEKLILVAAPEALKIRRFVERSSGGRTTTEAECAALEAEAERRIAQQWPDERKASLCDYVLTNKGAMTELEWQVDRLWPLLIAAERAAHSPSSSL